MEKTINKITKYLLYFLSIFIPFREIISLYVCNYAKFLPDIAIWSLFICLMLKNKFRLKLKIYDYLYIGFILIGIISCILNSVPLLSLLLQVRSISTMYILFYILRNVEVKKTTYNNVIRILIGVNIILIFFVIIEYFSDKLLFFPKVWASNIVYASNYARTYSLMNNPNTFATFTFMVMLLSYFVKDNLNKKNCLYYLLGFLGIILSASRSTILAILLFFIFLLYESFKKKNFSKLISIIIIFILSFIMSCGLDIIKNYDTKNEDKINISINNDNQNLEENVETNDNNKKPENNSGTNDNQIKSEEQEKNFLEDMAIIDRFKETTSGTTTQNSNVNGRLFKIKTGFKILKNHPLIGTGLGTYGSSASLMIKPAIYEKYNIEEGFYSDNEYIKVIVETGIIGSVIFCLFILSFMYYFIRERKFFKIYIFIIFLFYGLFYNVYEMQILCFILYISFIFLEEDYFKKNIKRNKISLLSLHLGFGGVEQVVVNTANMLSSDYEVEIISLYKNPERIPFKINKNIKITYLTNLISNKEKFKNAVKERKILQILKEGLKATYILINKNRFVRTAIEESDAKIIISSRYSFSKILNYYGRKNTYKIHHEHTYTVSDEYIYKLNQLKNIDYIIPVSKALYDEYKDKITIKLKYIPNALNYFPEEKELSKVNNKNLIAIGRCAEEKGFMDLLDIIKIIDDKEVILNVFGDGYQLNSLKEKAKKLNIESQVKFWGFKEQQFIKKYLKDSSLYIMTSFEESFGLVVIEAMSYGVPCISFDSAKGVKYIINTENGYYIKNRDKFEMATRIKNYFKLNNNKKIAMGKAARKTSAEYKYEIISQEWLKFIDNILEV